MAILAVVFSISFLIWCSHQCRSVSKYDQADLAREWESIVRNVRKQQETPKVEYFSKETKGSNIAGVLNSYNLSYLDQFPDCEGGEREFPNYTTRITEETNDVVKQSSDKDSDHSHGKCDHKHDHGHCGHKHDHGSQYLLGKYGGSDFGKPQKRASANN